MPVMKTEEIEATLFKGTPQEKVAKSTYSYPEYKTVDEVLEFLEAEGGKLSDPKDEKSVPVICALITKALKSAAYTAVYQTLIQGDAKSRWISQQAAKMFKARAAINKPVTMDKATAVATSQWELRATLDGE